MSNILMDVLFFISIGSLTWVMSMASMLFHEVGHMIMYILFYRNLDFSITVGSGEFNLLKTKRLKIKLIPFRGWFYRSDLSNTSKIKQILLFLGGPVFSLILLIILGYTKTILINSFAYSQSFFDIVLVNSVLYIYYYNLWLFLGSVIPINTKSYQSDGYKILHAIIEKK